MNNTTPFQCLTLNTTTDRAKTCIRVRFCVEAKLFNRHRTIDAFNNSRWNGFTIHRFKPIFFFFFFFNCELVSFILLARITSYYYSDPWELLSPCPATFFLLFFFIFVLFLLVFKVINNQGPKELNFYVPAILTNTNFQAYVVLAQIQLNTQEQ